MARPREFDEEKVLDRATRVFWERGFDATTVADLEAATGLVRTSLYGAFGDKEKLFLRVLERFQHRYEAFSETLMTGVPARAGFEAAFALWFGQNCSAHGPRGCLVQLASTTGADDSPKTRALVERSMAATEQMFTRALARAQTMGELPRDADLGALTQLLTVAMQGLSSAARSGKSRQELEPVVALLLATVFGPPRDP